MQTENKIDALIKTTRSLVQNSVDLGLAGASVLAYHKNQKVIDFQIGHQSKFFSSKYPQLENNLQPLSAATIFDLASLTKIFATTLAYILLVDKKHINLNDAVHKFLPKFKQAGKNAITIKNLLQHTSGLPATYKFYDDKNLSYVLTSNFRDKTIKLLSEVPLKSKPNEIVVYSDLGFMVLTAVLEQVAQQRLDEFCAENIYQPLGLTQINFNPMDKIDSITGKPYDKSQFEATEIFGNSRDGQIEFQGMRTQTLQGEVQDETCFHSMKGVSGHAGLFAPINEIAVLTKLILNKGGYENFKLCSIETFDKFLTLKNLQGNYALGFHIPNNTTKNIYGVLLPEFGNAFGHTAWTGKLFLVDYQHQSFIIICNNKKHSWVFKPKASQNHNIFHADLLPVSSYGVIIQEFYAYLNSC